MNSFAKAWLEAAKDLNIKVVHPFTFKTLHGVELETVGVYLPDFGSPNGTLLTCRFDSDEVLDLADKTEYFQSALNPHNYEPYSRDEYIEVLNDWGWFSTQEKPPAWFSGAYRKHGGA